MALSAIRLGVQGIIGDFGNMGSSARKNLNETRSRGESLTNTMNEMNTTISKGTERMRLFGIIGLGTMAALFFNVPIVQAGFNLLKASLTELFITLQSRVMPVFEFFSDIISRLATFIDTHPWISDMLAGLVALGVAVSLVVVLLFPLWAIITSIVGAVNALTGVLLGLGVVGSLFKVVFGPAIALLTKLIGVFLTLATQPVVWLTRGVGLILKALMGLGTLGLAIVGAFLLGVLRNWDEAFISIQRILDGFKTWFGGWFKVIEGIVRLRGDILKEGLVMIFRGAWDVIKGILDFIVDGAEGALLILQDIANVILRLLGFQKTNILGGLLDRATGFLRIGAEVGDAIIRPDGSIIRTDPADFLIATKDPGALVGGGTSTSVSVSFDGAQIILGDSLDIESLTDDIASQLSDKVRRVA